MCMAWIYFQATSRERPNNPNPSKHSWLDPERISLLQWHIPLGLPEQPARPGLKLRGLLPVVDSTRTPDPVVVPLRDADGKAFRQGLWVVRVEKGSRVGGGQPRRGRFSWATTRARPQRPLASPQTPNRYFIGDFLESPDRLRGRSAPPREVAHFLATQSVATSSHGELGSRPWSRVPTRLRSYAFSVFSVWRPRSRSSLPTFHYHETENGIRLNGALIPLRRGSLVLGHLLIARR